MGIAWTSDGHRLNKRWAFIAHAVCTESPKVGNFLGTPYWSVALLLCIMAHDDFVILRWCFLWYFYQINDTSMILLVRKFKMYHSSILLYVSYLPLRSAKKWYFDTFFIKKLFTYEHILNGKSKKYLIWNLIDTSFASKPHTPWTNGHRRVAELKIAGRRVKQR